MMGAMKRYYEACYSEDNVAADKVLPMGGSLFSAGKEVDLKILPDFENLGALFTAADDVFNGIKFDKLEAEMARNNITAEPMLFARLYAFQMASEKAGVRALDQNTEARRYQKYIDGSLTLSNVINDKCAQCAEMALAAHAYLKAHGVDNSFVSGNVFWKQSDGEFMEYNEPHAFIFIPQAQGGQTLYDPMNPTMFQGGFAIPSLYLITPAYFAAWEARADSQKSFMKLPHMITGQEALYGVSAPELSLTNNQIVQPPEALPRVAVLRTLTV